MVNTAKKVLDTDDAEEYLQIVTTFMSTVTGARTVMDIVIAAGIAEEELIKFRDALLFGEAAKDRLKLVEVEASPDETAIKRVWEAQQ